MVVSIDDQMQTFSADEIEFNFNSMPFRFSFLFSLFSFWFRGFNRCIINNEDVKMENLFWFCHSQTQQKQNNVLIRLHGKRALRLVFLFFSFVVSTVNAREFYSVVCESMKETMQLVPVIYVIFSFSDFRDFVSVVRFHKMGVLIMRHAPELRFYFYFLFEIST